MSRHQLRASLAAGDLINSPDDIGDILMGTARMRIGVNQLLFVGGVELEHFTTNANPGELPPTVAIALSELITVLGPGGEGSN